MSANNSNTQTLIDAYVQMSPQPMFLSSWFQSPPANFHTSEEVSIDIERDDEDIAVVVTDLSQGYRTNSSDLYTNKRFKPPVFKESMPFNTNDLLKRQPGVDPFQDFTYRANLINLLFKGSVKIDKKVRRSRELQAGQVLTTGRVILKDFNGIDRYILDFKPKATHFPNAGTTWTSASADPIADIESVGEEIRDNGKLSPDTILFGRSAWNAFIKSEEVEKHFRIRRVNQGEIVPGNVGSLGSYVRGTIDIGAYTYVLVTYGGRYKDPQTGVITQYIDPNKVVVRASEGRLDASFGAIPNLDEIFGTQQMLNEVPNRISDVAGGLDIFPNVWRSPDNNVLNYGVASRPLMIPTAIDTFGCITAIF